MKTLTLTVLAALCLAGCATPPATTASLTYDSTPDGAVLYEGDQSLGVLPVTRTYPADPKTGQVTTPDVKAVWPSGASVTYFTVIPAGSDRQAMLERPKDAPGLAQDQENAKKILSARKMEAARNKTLQQGDLARNSARCQAQMQGGNKGLTDDCG
jgi:hypothetical protein